MIFQNTEFPVGIFS